MSPHNRVIIFGASGTLGFQLVNQYLKRGWDVVAVSRDNLSRPTNAWKAVSIVRVPDGLELAKRGDATLVVNAIGCTRKSLSSSTPFTEANVSLAEIIAKHCLRGGLPLIHISTDCVFASRSGQLYRTISDVPEPCTIYGMTKWLGEEAVKLVGGQVTIARMSFFGPNYYDPENDGLFSWIVKNKDKDWTAYDAMLYNGLTSIEAAELLHELGKMWVNRPETVHLAYPLTVTKGDICREIARQLGEYKEPVSNTMKDETRLLAHSEPFIMQPRSLSRRIEELVEQYKRISV